ncbi:SDR family NAD(P)-dependent oxidoreductase [Oscillatoria sp. CS-180]|uniref:SDR family oxidoreductase n=1 Tax=Oscillatoria sp. CS-180 TaxID=3021720 RepID=UPI00232D4011|nr:SDR family oxidoreductase [Oscillatoria sp. CS-180]MDB9525686.1 SDR family NAD(P)-dependent oxidoreductase [Oscillatoria sp. CS-180]
MPETTTLKQVVVIGASRGIGAAVAQHFDALDSYEVTSISRSEAVAGRWISADISTAAGIDTVVNAVGNSVVDALLFMGGVWEENAFTDQYDFMSSSDAETRYVIAVNAIAPIELTKRLAKNLSKSSNARAIFIGSLSGIENCASVEVANTASKYSLRGAVQSLRRSLHPQGVGLTVINPENVATDEVLTDISEGRFPPQVPIPLGDIISAIAWILSLSKAVDVGDINLYQRE